jgi:hypothetical protein
MKCIQCGTDSKLKDRNANQGRCPKCRHPFAFEPTTMGAIKITDSFFARAIADVSMNNTVFFTRQQLFYFIDKRKRHKPATESVTTMLLSTLILIVFFGLFLVLMLKIPLPFYLALAAACSILSTAAASNSKTTTSLYRRNSATLLLVFAIVILAIGLPWSVAMNSVWGFGATAILTLASAWLGFFAKRRQSRTIAQFEQFVVNPSQAQTWLDRWIAINGMPEKLLPGTPPDLASLPIPPEVSAYSFDRLVVCDQAAIAHLLISNNFHFEHNCAILSIDGYPQNIFDTTMEMVRRNPELKIYALHDCSVPGVQLIHKIRTQPGWFPETDLPIIDVGISPRQAIAAQNLAVRQVKTSAQLPIAVQNTLTADERTWLEAGCYVSLQSLTPQRLMQILTRAIATSQTALEGGIDSSGAMIFVMGDDAGMGFYGAESFG